MGLSAHQSGASSVAALVYFFWWCYTFFWWCYTKEESSAEEHLMRLWVGLPAARGGSPACSTATNCPTCAQTHAWEQQHTTRTRAADSACRRRLQRRTGGTPHSWVRRRSVGRQAQLLSKSAHLAVSLALPRPAARPARPRLHPRHQQRLGLHPQRAPAPSQSTLPAPPREPALPRQPRSAHPAEPPPQGPRCRRATAPGPAAGRQARARYAGSGSRGQPQVLAGRGQWRRQRV